MEHLEHNSLAPEAFRGFLEGVRNLQDYLRRNVGESLANAEKQLDKSLAIDPNFAPARYYKAIVLTHARKADDAINLLEGLRQEDPGFSRAEVLYNLAFAYAREYKYDLFEKSLALLDEAYSSVPYRKFLGLPLGAKRPDLLLLINAMQAFVMAAFGGRPYRQDHSEFESRRKEYLPRAESLANSLLEDQRLKKLAPDARTAVKVEAHNAAGIAYMRMGQYSKNFEKDANQYWQLSEGHYKAALALHAQDVRVLDNLSTLNLIRACYALIHEQMNEMVDYANTARESEETAKDLNPHDRFRWLNLTRAYILLGEWREAATAADRILKEPGKVTKEDVEILKVAIDKRDITGILEAYPIEEESSP